MKPTNPMEQLQQWKANHQQAAINRFVNEMNHAATNKSDKNCETDRQFAKVQKANLHSAQKTQQEAQSEAKRQYRGKLSFNPLAFEYAQLSRQFKLILDSNRKCLEVYPDDFHHKLKFKAELTDLVEHLKAGSKLFNAVLKSHSTLSREDADTFKAFNQANGYLIYKFGEVVAQIDALNVERVENQKLQEKKE